MNSHLSTRFDQAPGREGAISDSAWKRALQWLEAADGLVITAGAGMGVDSGLPDFRGDEGLWRAYPALRQAGLNFVNIASPWAFRQDPELAWGFYGHRLNLYRDAVPHAGFEILQRWAAGMAHGAFVYTSNVDGQFQKAGLPPARIMECHGSLHWLQCMDSCSDHIWSADAYVPEVDTVACRLLSPLPQCPDCGGLVRPNVLMFGDGEWNSRRSDQQEAALRDWLEGVACPVVVELGAGTAVPTVRWFGSMLRAPIIRINLRESDMAGSRGIGLAGKALETLMELDRRLGGPAQV